MSGETGRLRLGYPGSSRNYIEMLEDVRLEDIDIEYASKENIYVFMDIGLNSSQTAHGKEMGADMTPWCDLRLVVAVRQSCKNSSFLPEVSSGDIDRAYLGKALDRSISDQAILELL